jgi:branched-chain amino acid transport system substrate-binding protein
MIRTTRSWRIAAAAVAAGLTLTACGTTDDSEGEGDTASGEGGSSCDATIAFLGPQTGDYANLGINIVNGAKVAMDEFTADNPDCKVELKEFDSQGDPEKATPLADQITGDDSIIGVVGPTFSGETDATGQTFADAGLVTVSASATNPDLAGNGWDTFHRLLGNDATQAPAAAKYISENLASEGVFVIDDASEYGKGISDGVESELGDLVVETDTVQQKQTDFGPTVTKIKASGADTVWFGGYYTEAGLLTKQLRAANWDGNFVSGDGSNDPGFVENAGAEAAEGAYLTCPCAPSTGDFLAKYKEINGQDPGTYSAEGYDAANVLLQGIADGNTDRESLLEWVNNYDDEGLTKHVKFDETGEVAEVVIYAYTVKDGKIELDTEIK